MRLHTMIFTRKMWNHGSQTSQLLLILNPNGRDMIPKDIPVPTPNKIQYKNVTGLFEGGGYSAKGIYRPAFDCRMNTNEAKGFCEVCQKAIEKMILFNIE